VTKTAITYKIKTSSNQKALKISSTKEQDCLASLSHDLN